MKMAQQAYNLLRGSVLTIAKPDVQRLAMD